MKPTLGHSRARATVLPVVTECTVDNLTHALVGAAIAKAGAERSTPLATATLVIAANAPDIDVLSYARGEYFALAFRRGITHGWLAIVLLPVLITGMILGWDRLIRRRRNPTARPARAGPVFALSFVGVLTHPTLDWMNTYGMRWALPFDGSWSYGDALFIVDPWIWLALGGAVFLASNVSRVGQAGWAALAALTSVVVLLGVGPSAALPWLMGLSGILALRLRLGSDTSQARTRGVRITGVAVLVYVAVMLGADTLASAEVRRVAADLAVGVEDVMVAPVRGNPFSSAIEIRTATAYVPGTHNWLNTPRVRLNLDSSIPLFAIAEDVPEEVGRRVAGIARTRTSVQNYLTWSRYPHVRVAADPDGWTVRFSDARYDDERGAGGLAGVTVHISRTDIQ